MNQPPLFPQTLPVEPSEPGLLWLYTRNDREQLRLYEKKYQGRPYFSLESWRLSDSRGWCCEYGFSLKRYDVRPLLRGLCEAVSSMGLQLHSSEREAIALAQESEGCKP